MGLHALVQNAITLIDDVLSQQKDNIALIDRVLKKADDLLDNKDDMAQVEGFFKNQVTVFDSAVKLERDLANELDYLSKEPEANTALNQIRLIIVVNAGDSKYVYKRIPELNDLICTVHEGHGGKPVDKNAIKKYAVWARRELISRVSQKAQQFGITEKEIVDVNANSVNGRLLSPDEKKQRQALIAKIKREDYEQVMAGNYLVYRPFGIEKEDDDWLINIELYSEDFRADLGSIWMDEMGLSASPILHRQVRQYKRFFSAKDRRAKVAAFAKNIATAPQFHLAVMSVQLLDKTRKISRLLHNNTSSKVVFNDICDVLTEVLESNSMGNRYWYTR